MASLSSTPCTAEHAQRVAKAFAVAFYEKLMHEVQVLHKFYIADCSFTVNVDEVVTGPKEIESLYVALGFNSMDELHSVSGAVIPGDNILVVVDGTFTFSNSAERRRLCHTFVLTRLTEHGSQRYCVATDVITIVDGSSPFNQSEGEPCPELPAAATASFENKSKEVEKILEESSTSDEGDLETEAKYLHPDVLKEMPSIKAPVEEKPVSKPISYAAMAKKKAPQVDICTDTDLNPPEAVNSKGKPVHVLSVRKMNQDTEIKTLTSFFSQFGKVLSVDFNESKSCAFVKFSDFEAIKSVLSGQPIVIEGAKVEVEEKRRSSAKNFGQSKGGARKSQGRNSGHGSDALSRSRHRINTPLQNDALKDPKFKRNGFRSGA